MSGVLEGVGHVMLGMLGVAILLSLFRLVRGPSLPDRVVALDLIALQSTGVIITYAVQTRQPLLLDVALVLAIISSLATIVIARYLFRGAGGPP